MSSDTSQSSERLLKKVVEEYASIFDIQCGEKVSDNSKNIFLILFSS